MLQDVYSIEKLKILVIFLNINSPSERGLKIIFLSDER